MAELIQNLVSTIIPVCNRPEMLREAVESVLAQTYRPIEIIISDDGSTDETPEVAGQLAKVHPDKMFPILNEHRGPGPAREAGRRIARGEFIQYLDSDDLLWPRKFEVQISTLRKHPECGVAYGRTRLVTIDGQVVADPFKWTGREFPTLFPWLLVDRWWCTHTPLYRRSVCDAVGPWSDLKWSQDWEYDARIGGLETSLVSCGKIVSDHRLHQEKRQTSSGNWLEPPDRVRFFNSLFENAIQAGVALDSQEMKHFSRWVFRHTRECGQLGDPKAAKACFELAMKASQPISRDLRGYEVLARSLGWTFTGKLFCWLAGLAKRSPGKRTLKLSWM